MRLTQLKSLEKRLSDFVEQFAPLLARSERRCWCNSISPAYFLTERANPSNHLLRAAAMNNVGSSSSIRVPT
jgi:hypothetical protein